MTKIYSIIIGEDPAYTATFHPSSKRKIALLASSMLIPVMLWFINGYMLVSHVLGGGIITGLLTATVAAFIIFLIERAVIMSRGNWVMGLFRVLLGLVIALLGSISMDEVVFKNDIDNRVAEYKEAYIQKSILSVDSSYQSIIKGHTDVVSQREQDWKESLKDATGEADGSLGSGVARVGKIAQLKMNVANLHEKNFQSESHKLQALTDTVATKKMEAVKKADKTFNSDALLLRIKAMFDLISEDIFMLLIYSLFTSFLFLIEFLVVIIKFSNSNSIDEELEDARIALMKTKAQKTLDKATQYFEPELADVRVQEARRILYKGVERNL